MENIEKKTPLNDLMDTTMDKIRDMVDSNTIIGEPITTPDGVTVIPADCLTLGEEEIKYILGQILCEFPVREIRVAVPSWVSSLEDGHALKESVY